MSYGQFGTGAEASIRHFGTSVELSVVRSQDHLAKPFTPFRGALTSTRLISNRRPVKLSSFALNRAVRQTSIICAADIARQQHRPEQGLDVDCVTSNQGRNYVHKVESSIMTETLPSFLFIFVAHRCRSVQTHRHCRCRSVWTLRHQCRYVLRTVRHWCRSVLGPNCLGSEVSVHLNYWLYA